jgi:uncharacterized repeat protein (TIGR02543 family)
MAGKKRSGLANDSRGYGSSTRWKPPPTYTVTYNGNTNTSGNAPIDSYSPRKSGSIVTVLGNSGSPALAKTGFTFSGWNTSANGSGISYSLGYTFVIIKSNVTLYAQWTPTYTVIYDGNTNTSGYSPIDGSSPHTSGSTVTVLGNSGSPLLEKTGFIFARWNTEANGSGTSYSQGTTFVINDNTTLYAQWTPTYTVVYDGNTNTSGYSPIDGSSPYASGLTVTILGNSGSPALAKTGYTFARWNTAANGSGIFYSQGNTFTINANTTLYAQWTPTYTVTYDGNEETSGNAPIDSSSPRISGSTVTVLGNSGSPVLAKTGFIFAGWNTAANGSGTSYSQGNTFVINSNTTLYAAWTLPPDPSAPSTPTALSSVGGNTEAYILFTQSGTVTNYEYSTDNGVTFVAFNPPQIYSPVNITALSSNGATPLTNGTTYTVKLKAVNAGVSSVESVSVDVVPTTTSLLIPGRIIYLDANNPTSYPGSGTDWTNIDSSGAYSATLNGAPTFDATDPSNKYFEFNPGALTGQFAQINQAEAINPVANQPFTIQMWVRINNVGSQGTLVSKVFGSPSWDGYALGYRTDNTLQLHANGSQINYFNSVAGVLSSGWALYTANVQFGNGGGRQNKLFVNGRQVMNVTSTDNISSPTQNLTFPTGFYGEGECDIGQFYYYNTELTTTQIIQNFDATKHAYI